MKITNSADQESLIILVLSAHDTISGSKVVLAYRQKYPKSRAGAKAIFGPAAYFKVVLYVIVTMVYRHYNANAHWN